MRTVFRGRRARIFFVASLTAILTGTYLAPVPAGAHETTAHVRKHPFSSAPTAKASAASGPGTLEICKSAAHGMAGRSFQFAINGASPIVVQGGGCSGSISMPAGNVTVAEVNTTDTAVQNIKANHVVTKNVVAGTATVKVVAGSTAATETLVTFTNQFLPVLGLKICKVADPLSLSLLGQLFTFTENGGPAFSVATGTQAAPVCGPIVHYALGTVVNVAELPTPITHVSAISVSDNRGSNVDLAAGTVSATVGSGVTVVTFTNAVNPIPQTGYVEVCKKRGDQFTSGNFDFTITAPGFTASQTVAVGQCSPAVLVPAGQVTVTEAAKFPSFVKGVKVVPKNRFVSKNLGNRTVTVTVPVGDTSTETMVAFNNAAQTGQIKICKTITANSGALAGTSYTFTVNSAVGNAQTDTVIAGAAGTTACVFHPTALPLGSPVSITENAVANVQNVAVSISPASQDTGSAPPTANLLVGAGVTTATFTNAALGTLEVCKTAADPATATQTFQFSVNGGVPISVPANQCSMPIIVPVGNSTVQEVGTNNFHLVSVNAVGPGAENRLVTSSTANPATVTVPFGGVANETVVTFTNAANTGELKICKSSVEPSLQNVTFQFVYSYVVNGSTVTGSAALRPGECSGLSPDVPVVDPNGNPIPIIVSEIPWPTVQVSNISIANGTIVSSNFLAGTATVNVSKGFTVVTFANVRTPFGTLQVCKAAADAATATRTFQLSIDNGAPISVHAGQCSPVMVVLSGAATVQEIGTPNFHLANVTATGPGNVNRLTSSATDNPATATVPSGDGSSTTVVTFTNAVDTGQFQICKVSTEPTLQSTAFSFTSSYDVTGTVTTNPSLKPGDCSTPSAAIPVVDPGGNPIPISISEAATLGVDVAGIGVDNGSLALTDLANGTTTAYVNKGITTVTYTNVLTPARTLVVCKTADDPSTATQTFQFSVNGGSSISVAAGACSSAITLPIAGTSASISEVAKTNFHLTGVTATGPSADNRLTTGSTDNPATVSVPFGGTANQTTVTFTNAVDTGQFQICKVSTEPTLQSTAFSFTASYDVTGTVTTNPSLKPGDCSTPSAAIPVVDPGGNPIPISISEAATLGVDVAGIGVDNGTLSGTNLATGSTSLAVKAGTTIVTYTNVLTPARTLVVCKTADDPSTASQTFQFEVNGGSPISVAADACSDPITLPIGSGTATVEEVAKTNFHLTGVTATGPSADNRLTTGSTDNPATVSVPFGGTANQTTVTFTNAVDTGQFQICKVSTEPTLQSTAFSFTASYDVTGTVTTNPSLKPGDCSTPSAAIPVVDPGGNPIPISISEAATLGVDVAGIGVDNGSLALTDLANGTTTAYVNKGITTVTYTNVLTPARTLVVCKTADDPSTASQTFQFEVNGGSPISVAADACSDPITLPIGSGTATVEEVAKTNFHLTGVTATGPSADNRLTTGSTDNPATVSVPFGGTANQTTVTFTNAVDTGRLSVCVGVSDPGLLQSTFDFDNSYTVNGNPVTANFTLAPNGCSAYTDPIPVVDPSGIPIPIAVSQTQQPGALVDDITVSNGTLADTDLGAGTTTALVNEGDTVVTYFMVPDVGEQGIWMPGNHGLQ